MTSLEYKDLDKAAADIKAASAKIDKAGVRRVLHPNTAARRKSKLARAYNAAVAKAQAAADAGLIGLRVCVTGIADLRCRRILTLRAPSTSAAPVDHFGRARSDFEDLAPVRGHGRRVARLAPWGRERWKACSMGCARPVS